jgi:sulfatase modifying factor 1
MMSFADLLRHRVGLRSPVSPHGLLATTALALLGAASIRCGGTTRGSSAPDASADAAEPDASPSSCAARALGAGPSCGIAANDDCCASLPLPAGEFDRNFDATESGGSGESASVSAFYLDKYEVTVGRYRAFVNAYPGSAPTTGAGAHPKIPGSGWDASWPIASDATGLLANLSSSACNGVAYTTSPGSNEGAPMTCLTWYEAFAFCAWDNGRLPTAAELNYAESGGAEARYYPWSSPATSTTLDATLAVFTLASSTMPLSGPAEVGSDPSGAGKWGHLDLAGNAAEWVLDVPENVPLPCDDCANLGTSSDSARQTRGGSWFAGFANPSVFVSEVDLRNARPNSQTAAQSWGYLGVRCARDQ